MVPLLSLHRGATHAPCDLLVLLVLLEQQGFVLTCSTYPVGPGVKLELSANAEMWNVSLKQISDSDFSYWYCRGTDTNRPMVR